MRTPHMSFKNVLNRRMPTALALVLLLVGLGATIFLVQKTVTTNTNASPEETPLDVVITNITNNSFSVVFTTVAKSRAAVAITDSAGNPQLFYDARDPDNAKGSAFYAHEIVVGKLEAQTSYNFTILSNAKVYKDQGKDYTATTFPTLIENAPNQPPLTGMVNMPDATPARDTVVVARIDGASPVAAITNDRGIYTIPLTSLRTTNGVAYYPVPNETKITLNFYHGTDTSRVSIAYLKELTSLPSITLGQNYSFAGGVEEVQSEPSDSAFVLPTPITVRLGQIQIISPRQDESFTDTQPLFRGTAQPNAQVTVIMKNASIKEKVISDARGAWSFRPGQALPSGSQTLTIQTPDAQGFTRQLSVPFTIFASGSQVAESATPSATLTPTNVPTATQTPTPTIIGSLSPTIAPTATPTIFASPTPTQFVLITTTPAPQIPPKSLPPTGDISLPVIVSVASMFFLVVGSALLFML